MSNRLGILPAAILVASSTFAQNPFQLMATPERVVARAADADQNGEVSGDEWSSFVSRFEPAEDGTLDRRLLLGRALVPIFDTDGDGVLRGDDASSRLTGLDANGDGMLDEDEMQAPISSGGRGGRLIEGVIAFGADLDSDGFLSANEWRIACHPPEEIISDERLVSWLAGAELPRTEDRSLFEPATLLLSMYSAFDVDTNGRITREDLDQMFSDLDTDEDGNLTAAELARPSRRRGEGRGDVLLGTPGDEPLMPWQRSLEDALALSQATQKPLLICVNMDGEAASESLAARRYRTPEFVELARGFIPLLVSPDRRNPRDHDDRGRRIPDSKFGRLVNAEHMDHEPMLYARYFYGQRVAPRHVGVSPEGEILFDLFLLQDLSAIDRKLREHGNFDTELPDVTQLDAESLLEYPDAAARDLLEQKFFAGDDALRRTLAIRALPDTGVQHPEIVRLGLRDRSPAVRIAAVKTMARHPERVSVELFPDALRVAHGSPELIAALSEGLAGIAEGAEGNTKVRARRLARISAASLQSSRVVDVGLWRLALVGSTEAAPVSLEDPEAVYRGLEEIEGRLRSAPDDPQLNALFARVALRGAQNLIENGGGNPSFLLQDAEVSARRAVEVAPDNALAWAYLANATFLLSDFEAAGEAAVRALPGLIDMAGTKLAADTLRALADCRTRQLYAGLGTDEGWNAEWAADVLAAYEVLLAHPFATEQLARAGLDVQTNLEAYAVQGAYLRRALKRFPASGTLHNYFRWQVLRDGGADALLVAYDDIEFSESVAPTVRWYAGLANLVAAEHLVKNRDLAGALSAYAQCRSAFLESAEQDPEFEGSAMYYVAHAHAADAKIHLDSGRLEDAVIAIRACAATAAENAFMIGDGLGNTPMGTAREILQALRAADRAEAADALEEFLAEHHLDTKIRAAGSADE